MTSPGPELRKIRSGRSACIIVIIGRFPRSGGPDGAAHYEITSQRLELVFGKR